MHNSWSPPSTPPNTAQYSQTSPHHAQVESNVKKNDDPCFNYDMPEVNLIDQYMNTSTRSLSRLLKPHVKKPLGVVPTFGLMQTYQYVTATITNSKLLLISYDLCQSVHFRCHQVTETIFFGFNIPTIRGFGKPILNPMVIAIAGVIAAVNSTH